MTLQNTLKFVAACAVFLGGMKLGHRLFPREDVMHHESHVSDEERVLEVGPEDMEGGANWDAFGSLGRVTGVGNYLILDLILEQASGMDAVIYDGRRMPVVRESSPAVEAMQVSTCTQLDGDLWCRLTSEAAIPAE